MSQLLDGRRLPRELDLMTRRYFEVTYCDQVDLFIYLLGHPKSFLRRLKVEGREHLDEALKNEGGMILSAHFGGGFWILPFLRDLGVRAHFFSADIKRENYPHKMPLYLYERLGNWAAARASGRRILYKQGGRKILVDALGEKKWVIVLFDVPPILVKDNTEVRFLGRKAWFPKGIISIARELNVPLLFFFSYLDGGKQRKICFEKSLYVKNEEDCVETCVRLIERKILERPDHWHFWPFADQFFSS